MALGKAARFMSSVPRPPSTGRTGRGSADQIEDGGGHGGLLQSIVLGIEGRDLAQLADDFGQLLQDQVDVLRPC